MSAEVNNCKWQTAASVYLFAIFSYRCHANAEVTLSARFWSSRVKIYMACYFFLN
jgi:hypothetical protein